MSRVKLRDGNILKNYKREINISQRVIQDKTKYNRKEKHKNRLSY